MRKILFLILILIVSCTTSSEKKEKPKTVQESKSHKKAVKKVYKNDREKFNLKGNVRKVVIKEINIANKTLKSIKEIEFDAAGKIKYEILEIPENNFFVKTEKIYNESGDLIKEIVKDKKDKELEIREYVYENNLLVEKNYYNSKGQVVMKEVNYYLDTIPTYTEFFKNNKLFFKLVYEYDNGNKIKEIKINPRGDTLYIHKFYYDEAGNIIKKEEFGGNGRKILEYEFEYDTLGNKILEISKNVQTNALRETKFYYNDKEDIYKTLIIYYLQSRNDTMLFEYEYRYDSLDNWITRLEKFSGNPNKEYIREIIYYQLIE